MKWNIIPNYYGGHEGFWIPSGDYEIWLWAAGDWHKDEMGNIFAPEDHSYGEDRWSIEIFKNGSFVKEKKLGRMTARKAREKGIEEMIKTVWQPACKVKPALV